MKKTQETVNETTNQETANTEVIKTEIKEIIKITSVRKMYEAIKENPENSEVIKSLMENYPELFIKLF